MAVNRNRNGNTFRRAQGTCARCGRPGEIRARGLDVSCYEISRRKGTLANFTRRRTNAETLEDIHFLASTGCSREEIAARLGMTPEGVRVTLWRARKVGGEVR